MSSCDPWKPPVFDKSDTPGTGITICYITRKRTMRQKTGRLDIAHLQLPLVSLFFVILILFEFLADIGNKPSGCIYFSIRFGWRKRLVVVNKFPHLVQDTICLMKLRRNSFRCSSISPIPIHTGEPN